MIICVVAPRIWFRLSSKIGQSCQWANGDEDHHDEENRFHSKFKCPRAENNISRLWLRRLNRFAVGVGDSWHHASDSPSWLLISLLAQIRRPLVKWVKAIWLPSLSSSVFEVSRFCCSWSYVLQAWLGSPSSCRLSGFCFMTILSLRASRSKTSMTKEGEEG